MKKWNFIFYVQMLIAVCMFNACSDDKGGEDVILPEKPFYIVNEGSPDGSVNYYDPETDLWKTGLYQEANDGNTLGVTTQMGVIYGKKFYFPYKGGYQGSGGGIIVADAGTLEHLESVVISGVQVYGFCVIDDNRGVATTDNGSYLIQLTPLKVGARLSGSDGKCGDCRVSDGKIFITSEDGILVYGASDLSLQKKLQDAYLGFARTPDGYLWAGKEGNLIRIDPASLETETISMPGKIRFSSPWGAWRPASLCASATENVLYFVPDGGEDNAIYRFVVGDPTSLNEPFAVSSVAEDSFYGALAISPATGNLIVTAIESGWGEHSLKNRILFFDRKSGKEIKRFEYNDGKYYFPAMVVF